MAFETNDRISEPLQEYRDELKSLHSNIESSRPLNDISDDMFEQILKMEGDQNFSASVGKKFWENFVTWSYGQVYKRIDDKGNLLKNPVPFKDNERVTPSWAKKNARACYRHLAGLRKMWLGNRKYNQNMFDALVCQSWWNLKWTYKLRDYVLKNWGNVSWISQYLKTSRTKDNNNKTQPGLVKRAQFAANWFMWNKKPFTAY